MNINNQLGIPTMLHEYDNFTHIDNYANAGGRGKAKVKNFFNKAFSVTPVGMVVKGIKNADTQRVTSADRDAAEQWVMNSFGNQLLEAKTLDQIDYWAGVMADQKVDMEMMLGKRKSGVGNVLSFGRQYKRRGKNAGLCTNDGCIRQSQARLDALNQFEVRHNTAITTLRKKLEKQIEEKPPVAGDTTTEKNLKVGAATMPPIGSQPIATITPTETSTSLTDTNAAKGQVVIAGKTIKTSTLIFGAVGLGIAGILFFKLR